VGLVWLANGLWCKVLGMVPRHKWIVARFTGAELAPWLTKAIGGGEILLAIWVSSKIRPKTCAWLQIGLVATMNTPEFFMAPDLLLWGLWNALFAMGFIAQV